MPVRDRALLGAVREIGLEPHLLGRAHVHRDVRVQGDDVPVTDVVAVVAFARCAGGRAEVVEVPGGAGGEVVVVAGDRLGARLEPAPGRIVAVLVVAARAVRIGVVARREHRAGNGVHQVRGEGIPGLGTVRDISSANQHVGRDHLHGRRVHVRRAAAVRHAHTCAVRAQRRVDMGGADRRRLTRRAARGRRVVAPGDRVGPGRVARVGIAERRRQVDRVSRIGGDVGAGAHGGRRAMTAGGA